MNERQVKLIKSGVKLFAEKGYHNTSIEEIATKAGISKGAFYLYFESKEAFIGAAVEYFHTQIINRIDKVSEKGLPPKENLAEQISVIIQYVYEFKPFIVMHLRENIAPGKNMDELIEKMNIDHFHWIRSNVEAIYGEKINDYLIDTIIQLEGLLNGYFKWIVIDHIKINKAKAGRFIVRRLDNIVEGMLADEEGPVVEVLPEYDLHQFRQLKAEQLTEHLLAMKEKVSRLFISEKHQEKLYEVIDMILKKSTEQNKNKIVIQGLLTHLQREKELVEDCEKISELLEIELLKGN